MAERRGRVGGGGGASGVYREADDDLDARGARPGGRGLTGLLALAASGLVLYMAWWVLWERSHPAASAARRVSRGDAADRLAALRELGTLDAPDPEVALPALVVGLADPEPLNRATAAMGLASSIQDGGPGGPTPQEAREAMAGLLDRLADPVAMVRARAARAICTIAWAWHVWPPVIDLDAALARMARLADDPDDEVRASAVQGLSALSHRSGEAPPERLIAALDDPSEMVRSAAAQSLGPFHRAMVGSLPALVAAMERARPECRPAYLAVLRRFRPAEYSEEAAAAIHPALISALGSRDPQVRCEVAAMLGDFGTDARPAIPALLAVLDDPGVPGLPGPGHDGFSRHRDPAIAAAEALRRVAGDEASAGRARGPARAPEVVASLIRLLGSPTAGRRLSAVYALTSFEADEAVVAALIAACRDRDEPVRVAALMALQGRGARLPSRAREVLGAAMEDPSPQVRWAAASALIGFGAGVEPMVPALIRRAGSDPGPSVRDAAARALGSIGPAGASPAVVPLFIEAIDRPGAPSVLRENLIAALIRFGPAARAAVPAIVRALRSSRSAPPEPAPHEMEGGRRSGPSRSADEQRAALRGNAARALGVLAADTPAAVDAASALADAVDDPADAVSEPAGEALAALGPAARGAVPALLAAMRRARADHNIGRAGRMAEVIGRIDPGAPAAAAAVALLGELLRSDDVLARLFAERAVIAFGPAAAPAVTDLVALARHPSIRTSPELPPIAAALGRIAPGTPGASPALAALLDWLRAEPAVPDVETVIEALARFGPAASAASPSLRRLMESKDPESREAARKALAVIEGVHP